MSASDEHLQLGAFLQQLSRDRGVVALARALGVPSGTLRVLFTSTSLVDPDLAEKLTSALRAAPAAQNLEAVE